MQKAAGASGGDYECNGSRRIRMNVYGNWNGYEGARKVREFGTNELAARDWLNHREEST